MNSQINEIQAINNILQNSRSKFVPGYKQVQATIFNDKLYLDEEEKKHRFASLQNQIERANNKFPNTLAKIATSRETTPFPRIQAAEAVRRISGSRLVIYSAP